MILVQFKNCSVIVDGTKIEINDELNTLKIYNENNLVYFAWTYKIISCGFIDNKQKVW